MRMATIHGSAMGLRIASYVVILCFMDTYDGILPYRSRSVNPTGNIDLTATSTAVPVEESMDF